MLLFNSLIIILLFILSYSFMSSSFLPSGYYFIVCVPPLILPISYNT